MNQQMDDRVNAAAEAFAQRMQKYPIEEQIAVGVISNNVLNGCSWGFVADNADIRQNKVAFENSKTCGLQAVTFDLHRQKFGYLVSMRLDYLLALLQRDAPGLIEIKDLERASKHHQEARVKMARLLSDKKFAGRIGVLCTNNSPTITDSGKTFPAFAVTFKEALQLCVTNGYGLMSGGKVYDPNQVYKKMDKVMEASIVAPSRNAMYMDIAPMSK